MCSRYVPRARSRTFNLKEFFRFFSMGSYVVVKGYNAISPTFSHYLSTLIRVNYQPAI